MEIRLEALRCDCDDGRMSNQLPPQSSDAEESIIGALLIDGEVMIEIAEILKPSDFYKPANGKVYAAIAALYEKQQPIDILTVSEELERRGRCGIGEEHGACGSGETDGLADGAELDHGEPPGCSLVAGAAGSVQSRLKIFKG